MPTVTTPQWSEAPVVAAAVLARGATVRGTLDLRTKNGARIFCRIGRGGTAALTNGVDVLIRALLANGVAGGEHPASLAPLLSGTVAASSTTVNADSAATQPALNVASVSGFAAGDIVCVQDAGAGVTRLEFHRVSKTAAGVLTLDRHLGFTHTAAQGDTVRSKADVFPPLWLNGGTLYEVVFDYGDDVAGDAVTVEARAQTYDLDSSTA